MSELTRLTISDARNRLRAGDFTATELTQACLDAIEGAGALGAFIHKTPEIALKQAAAQRGSSIGRLIDAALDHYGIKPREQAIALVQRARAASALDDAPAVELALHEQHAVRARRRAQ